MASIQRQSPVQCQSDIPQYHYPRTTKGRALHIVAQSVIVLDSSPRYGSVGQLVRATDRASFESRPLSFAVCDRCPTRHRLIRELLDADSATVPAASTGGDASQQREIVSRGNRACGSKVGTTPGKAWDPQRGEENRS